MDEVPIRLHIELLDEGVYLATSPDVPGLVVQADTVAEVIEIAKDVTKKIAEAYLDEGWPLPPALKKRTLPEPLDVCIAVGGY